MQDSLGMPILAASIQETLLNLPPARRIKLAEKLMASVEGFATPGTEAAWNIEIAARVKEIRAGRAKGIPAEEVMKQARKHLNEARRLSPARRRRTH